MDQTLIIGLGNPDPTLAHTYHNVGVLAVEWIAEHARQEEGTVHFRRHGDSFEYAKIANKIFVRPLVFMNESGRAVHDAMIAFKIAPKDIAILHDDSDIPVGEFKSVSGGGSAGHNGIRSIIDHLHTEDFARIRIGIREPYEAHRKKAGEFVLSPISTADRKIFEDVFKTIASSLPF
jgi:peptidyl-tRNA hydrolase, PTH1 family